LPDVKQIYQSFADRYEALVSREDFQENLLPAILEISDLKGTCLGKIRQFNFFKR